MGPTVSRVHVSGITPAVENLSIVTFSAEVPVTDAGIRTLPPVSVPSAIAEQPAETATAGPPLEPPGMRAGSHIFRTAPNHGLFDVPP